MPVTWIQRSGSPSGARRGHPREPSEPSADHVWMEPTTPAEVQGALGAVASPGQAKAAIRRASKLVGVQRDEPLELRELVRLFPALAAEGGPIQQLAEQIAGDALQT